MNALLWIVVLAVGIIFLVLVPFFALSYLLAARPHSKKKTAEQARLDKRTGNATTSTDATSEKKKEESGNKLWEWTGKNFWSILLVLAGVVVFFYGKSPDIADMGSWSRNHWLLILILWGIVATIIAINAGKAAKTLQTILAVIVFALFIGFPIIGLVKDDGKPITPLVKAKIICPDVSALETRSCIVTTEWSNWIKPAEGVANNGMYLRYGPQELVNCESRLENGLSQYRFRAKEGQAIVSYRFVRADQLHIKNLL